MFMASDYMVSSSSCLANEALIVGVTAVRDVSLVLDASEHTDGLMHEFLFRFNVLCIVL